MAMNENDMLNGDDDYSQGNEGEERVCRDFMRNVCNRGNNCKFIHPHDIKIRNDPIFCHDYQQTKCFRSTCKFIHCTREEEEHYKSTGELPETFTGGDGFSSSRGGKGMRGKPSARQNGSSIRGGPRGGGRGGGGVGIRPGVVSGWEADDSDIPLCKDYLKGVCDRPVGGCKFRHADQDSGFRGTSRGAVGALNRRRPGAPSYYDGGPSDTKRSNNFGGVGRGNGGRLTEFEQYDDYYNPEYSNPPAPVGSQPVFSGTRAAYGTSMLASHHSATSPSYLSGRNGYGSFTNNEVANTAANPYATTVFAATSVKAVEDENFMLKRRIEELKKQVSDLVATNEYLLSQNAHLRLNNMNVNAIMAKEVQNVTGAGGVTGTSVVQTLVSMAPSMGMTPSLSVAATPISLSSISTGPAVVSLPAASISQPLPAVVSMSHQAQSVYPMVTTQGVLPPN